MHQRKLQRERETRPISAHAHWRSTQDAVLHGGQVIKAGMKFPKRNETKQTEVLPRMHILWYVLSLSVAV